MFAYVYGIQPNTNSQHDDFCPKKICKCQLYTKKASYGSSETCFMCLALVLPLLAAQTPIPRLQQPRNPEIYCWPANGSAWQGGLLPRPRPHRRQQSPSFWLSTLVVAEWGSFSGRQTTTPKGMGCCEHPLYVPGTYKVHTGPPLALGHLWGNFHQQNSVLKLHSITTKGGDYGGDLHRVIKCIKKSVEWEQLGHCQLLGGTSSKERFHLWKSHGSHCHPSHRDLAPRSHGE